MTREEALVKLLRVEPETRAGLILVTGWPAMETCEVLDNLVRRGDVQSRRPWQCIDGERLYFVE